MIKLSNRPYLLLIIIGIISLGIVTATVVAYYRSSLIHFSGTLDKDYFPAFGSFISGTVGLILSIASVILIYYTFRSQQKQLEITRGLVDRQISLSVKPDLVVEKFESIDASPKTIVDAIPLDAILPRNLHDINLRILNIGIEAARYIEYSFYYDIHALITYYSDIIGYKVLEIEHFYKSSLIRVKNLENNFEWGFSVEGEQSIAKKDYLLPYKLNSDFFEAKFPMLYVIFFYYVMSSKFKGVQADMDGPLHDVPKCYLDISFEDLEGKSHKKRFHTKLEFSGLSLKYPSQKQFPNQW